MPRKKAVSGGSEMMYDPDLGQTIVMNDSAVPDLEVMTALAEQHPEVAAMVRWSNQTQPRRFGGIFQRDRYLSDNAIFHQFQTCMDASETDDIVGNVVDLTESIAISRLVVSVYDEDEEELWNQIIDYLDLSSRFREMWREIFCVSQCYYAILWGTKDFKLRGKTSSGNKKKKEFKGLRVPIGVTILDPLKVIPVGNFMFNQERLVYIANRTESQQFDLVLAGANTTDLIADSLIEDRYIPTREEKRELQAICGTGIKLDNLFYMKSENVFRHTSTRPQYARFATPRMKSVFELLDMKQQLREMDRAHLVGGTNFIVLVKKGSDAWPAKPAEVNALTSQVRQAARVPVIVGDHRLAIEIITPKMDMVLQPEKYNALDARITARLFQIFFTGNYAAGAKGDDSIKLARLVAKGMESRREDLRDNIQKNVIEQIFERNPSLLEHPDLMCQPKRISLDFDPNVLGYMQELRDRGDISRETLLSELDLDQGEEALRREREAKHYDKIFKPILPPVPPLQPHTHDVKPKPADGKGSGTKPNATPSANPKAAGSKGGRAGGTNRQSFTTGPPRGPAKAELELNDEEE